MAERDKPQPPFAGMADISARTPVRVISPDEIERMLAEHRLYLETEYHQSRRAHLSSTDLTRRDFFGLDHCRGVALLGR
jgi:tRNA G10  N-methylase Trm11